MTIKSPTTPITSLPLDATVSYNLQEAVRMTFGQWLEETGHSLDEGPQTITESISTQKIGGVDGPSGYSWESEKITPTLRLGNMVIDGQHHKEVLLPGVTVHGLLSAATMAGKIPGKPSDADRFPPSAQEIAKETGLQNHPQQLKALQEIQEELGPETLAQAVKILTSLNK